MSGGLDRLRIAVFIDLLDFAGSLAERGSDVSAVDWDGLLARLMAEGGERALGLHALPPRGVGIYVYASLDPSNAKDAKLEEWVGSELGRRPEVRLVLLRAGVGECHACAVAGTSRCLRCRGNAASREGHSLRDAIRGDLLRLTREDVFDVALLVSSDYGLIPAVHFLRGRGKSVVHAGFAPRGADLAHACSVSIDLSAK